MFMKKFVYKLFAIQIAGAQYITYLIHVEYLKNSEKNTDGRGGRGLSNTKEKVTELESDLA